MNEHSFDIVVNWFACEIGVNKFARDRHVVNNAFYCEIVVHAFTSYEVVHSF